MKLSYRFNYINERLDLFFEDDEYKYVYTINGEKKYVSFSISGDNFYKSYHDKNGDIKIESVLKKLVPQLLYFKKKVEEIDYDSFKTQAILLKTNENKFGFIDWENIEDVVLEKIKSNQIPKIQKIFIGDQYFKINENEYETFQNKINELDKIANENKYTLKRANEFGIGKNKLKYAYWNEKGDKGFYIEIILAPKRIYEGVNCGILLKNENMISLDVKNYNENKDFINDIDYLINEMKNDCGIKI